jgi:hypothetical protein
MKFLSIIKKREDTASAVIDAQWRYDGAVNHLKKVRSMKPDSGNMNQLSALSDEVVRQQELIERLENELKKHENDAELADYRIKTIDPIIVKLSPVQMQKIPV